jgi:hypothetical protein
MMQTVAIATITAPFRTRGQTLPNKNSTKNRMKSWTRQKGQVETQRTSLKGEKTGIKARHEDGYRQMVSWDEKRWGGKWDGCDRYQTKQIIALKQVTYLAERRMSWRRNSPTGCILITIAFHSCPSGPAAWWDMARNWTVFRPPKPYIIFLKTWLRQPSNNVAIIT